MELAEGAKGRKDKQDKDLEALNDVQLCLLNHGKRGVSRPKEEMWQTDDSRWIEGKKYL